MTKRAATFIAVTAALVSLAGPTLTASVSAAPSASPTLTKTVASRSEYTVPFSSLDAVDCGPLAGGTPQCGFTLVGPTEFTGTIHGQGQYAERGRVEPDGKLAYDGSDYFYGGGIVGCGLGEFVAESFDGWVDLTKWDVATNSAPAFNRWRILPNSGTGDLTGLTGEGENHWRMYFNDVATQRWGRGLYTGTLTCRVPQT